MTRRIGRRGVLGLLASGGAMALLAACGGAAPTAAPTAAPAATKPAGQPTAAGAAQAAPTGAAASSATGGASAPAAGATAAPAATAASKPAAGGQLKGTFWFNQPPQQKAFNAIVDKFHQSQQQVQLTVVLVPGADLPAKLTTAIAGGDPPDAARVGGASTNAIFIQSGQAAALDNWDPKIGTYDWLKPAKDSVSLNNKMYAMPVNSGAQALIYNRDLYKASGLDPDKPPATMDELMQDAIKLTKPAEQTWGHEMLTAPITQTGGDYFSAVLFAFGGKDVTDDGKVVFNSPEGVAALQWQSDLIQKNKAMPVKKVDETSMLNDYLTGKLGSMCCYPALIAAVEAASFKSGSTAFPRAKQPPGPSPFGVGTITVFDKAKAKDAGWAFASFVGLDVKIANLWATSFGQLPCRPSYREDASWTDYAKQHPIVGPFADAQKDAQLVYYGPGSSEMFTELGKAVEAVSFGQKQPKQALDDAAAAGQQILDRERKK